MTNVLIPIQECSTGAYFSMCTNIIWFKILLFEDGRPSNSWNVINLN